MDPFTILNAAGNIAQFVEYTRDVYVQIGEIRSSGAGITRRNTEIVWSASELSGMVDNINNDLGVLDKACSPTEKRIREIGQKCQTLAAELRTDIERKGMKNRAHAFAAFKSVAFKSWKPNELDAKLGELDRLQDLLFKNMIIHISNQQNSMRTTMARLAEQNHRLGVAREDAIDSLGDDLLTSVSSCDSSATTLVSPNTATEINNIKEKLEIWTSQASSFKKEHTIISSLHFDNMFRRQATILDPHTETFSWIYDQRLHFKEWLEADEGIYWVTGDAGSGKSTLMKFLSDDDVLNRELAKWAGSQRLIKASFYFWFSGSKMQKSQEGLLRSLLFEIFRQCPDVIRSACPERWNEEFSRTWYRDELMQTFRRLDLQSSSSKFCLFIDGLDEYHEEVGHEGHGNAGSAAHVAEIIEVMDVLSKLNNVKICLSSRPWHVFEEAYGSCEARKLYVDRENRGDIERFVRDRFEQSEAFKRAQARGKSEEITELVEEVVQNSNGVFLWVSLVVESLLRGLSNKDNITELRRRLTETPKTLNGMFERMLSSVEDRYHEQAAQILQVALYADEPLDLFAYSYIGEKEGSAIDLPIRAWTEQECIELAETTEARIKVRCPDLIKVNNYRQVGEPFNADGSKMSVEFLHRTVGDFLSLEETQAQLRRRLKKGFDPGRFVCEALLAVMKGSQFEHSPNWSYEGDINDIHELASAILVFAKKAEVQSSLRQRNVLDGLHTVVSCRGWLDDTRVPYLALMVRRELKLYVEDHLPQALTQDPGHLSLLECALTCPDELMHLCDGGLCPSVDMVTLLLEKGANPNELPLHQKHTVWEQFLIKSYRKISGKKRISQKYTQAQLGVMKAMLEHGADASVRCRYEKRGGEAKVMDLVELLDELFHYEDTAYLEALIRHKQNMASEDRGLKELQKETPSEGVPGTWIQSLTSGIGRPLGWLGLPAFS